MRFLPFILTAISTLPLAKADDNPPSLQPELYEAIHQAEYILAETLDTKNYDLLEESMTDDVIYDSRLLGPGYAGLSVGLVQTTDNIRAAFGDALVAHHASNAIMKPHLRVQCFATVMYAEHFVVNFRSASAFTDENDALTGARSRTSRSPRYIQL